MTAPPCGAALDRARGRRDSCTMLDLSVNGAALAADPSGALVWPARRTVIVSDLHFEKGSALAARGVPVPPFDTTATIERLADALARHRPASVICLGDSFHDQAAAGRITPLLLSRIRALSAAADWIWIAGNHDPAPAPVWGGRVMTELAIDGLTFRHQAETGADSGEISGHYHPKARIGLRGRTLSAACFVTDGDRLVMPAFGAFAGGLDVASQEIRALFPRRFDVLLRGPRRLYRFPDTALVPARRRLRAAERRR